MINLNLGNTNEFAIYADTIDNSVVDYGDYFLLGFKSLYTNQWTYVVPQIITRNSRFVKFNLIVLEGEQFDDPLNGIIGIFPPGNYSYKCWSTNSATLDPSAGILIDQGQMIMADYTPPEVETYTYISDNETFASIIYYSGTVGNDCYIYIENSPFVIEEDTTNYCQPLIIAENGGYLLVEDGVTFSLN